MSIVLLSVDVRSDCSRELLYCSLWNNNYVSQATWHLGQDCVGSPLLLVSAVVLQTVPAHCLSDKQFSAKNTLFKTLHFSGECD